MERMVGQPRLVSRLISPLSSMSPSSTSVDLPEIFTLPPPVTFRLSSTNDAANAGLRDGGKGREAPGGGAMSRLPRSEARASLAGRCSRGPPGRARPDDARPELELGPRERPLCGGGRRAGGGRAWASAARLCGGLLPRDGQRAGRPPSGRACGVSDADVEHPQRPRARAVHVELARGGAARAGAAGA